MPLIHVEHLGLVSQGLQGAHAPDAQQELLADASIPGAVQPQRGPAVFLGRLRDVGVQQVEGTRPTWTRQICAVNGPPGQLHMDLHRRPVLPARQGEGQVEEVVVRVQLALPAVGVEVLAEVSFLIGQADRDEQDAQVTRRLEVVAGQYPQPPE